MFRTDLNGTITLKSDGMNELRLTPEKQAAKENSTPINESSSSESSTDSSAESQTSGDESENSTESQASQEATEDSATSAI